MRSKIWIAVVAVLGLGVFAQPAHALVFSDFVDTWGSFNVLGPGDTGSIEIDDSPDSADGLPEVSWVHDILAEIAPNLIGNILISDAKLTISYRKTNSNETWTLFGDGTNLGDLLSTDNTILTTDFPLNAAALASLQSDGVLNTGLEETTAGNDKFRLYQSTLSGNYTVNSQGGGGGADKAPEPGSLLLMGSGLLGFMGSRRFRKKLKG